MSRRSKSRKKHQDLLGEVSRLGAAGATGVLTVQAKGTPCCRVYLMGGDVIACNEDDGGSALGGLLLSAGAVDASVLESLSDENTEADLGDLLVRRKHVSGADLMAARAQLFRDGFLTAAAQKKPKVDFEEQDAVFPDNMQFGVDRDALVQDAKVWVEATASARELLRDSDRRVVAIGDRPVDISEAAWERLGEPQSGPALLDALGQSREHGLLQLAGLLSSGALLPADHQVDAPTEVVEDPSALRSTVDAPEPALLELTEIEPDDVAVELEAVEEPEEEEPEDDYERAKRGAFIKSYEVLDKVDLSGVEVLGAGDIEDAHEIEMGDEIEAVALEMGDEDELVALGDVDDVDDVLAELDDPPQTAPQLARLHREQGPDVSLGGTPGDDDFAMFDTGDLDGDIEEEFQVEDQSDAIAHIDDEDESGLLVTGDQIELSSGDDGPFRRTELADFHERIDIFNNIFRIIFRTFSEHIGPDNALQRFNALLSSNQRQYPELFADILVADDGSVQPAPLINNLSNCTAGDYGSLLHQGLYELIFSHLYDAKDMLPGDVESGMMEQILVFERQLHQG